MSKVEQPVATIRIEPARVPTIAGARNLRDLGGYRTADGNSTRWGRVFRSGSLAQLTPQGFIALQTLGLHSLCDLRTTGERQVQPFRWRDNEDLELNYWCRDYETSFGELRKLMNAGMADGTQASAAMIEGYRKMPFEQAPAYREIFSRLALGQLPLVFCCSAGKDRTGIAAALILTALGVPRETVIADYLLTDSLVNLEFEIVQRAVGTSSLSQQPADVVAAILRCNAAYISAVLDAVAPSPAAFTSYLSEMLGIDAAALASLRAHLLE